MKDIMIKFALTTMGVIILVGCIVGEVDGIGRAAMIFSGVAFTYVGAYYKKKTK